MRKVKLSFISILGCLVLAAVCSMMVLLAADTTDQVLTYSTFLNGPSTGSHGHAVAVDVDGFAYVTGRAGSDFPVNDGSSPGGIFVVKLDPNGADSDGLIWSTCLGGSGQDFVYGIALDNVGNVYIVGSTNSDDFPITDGTPLVGDGSIYVAKFNNSGTRLYSTIIGEGGGARESGAIAVDSDDKIYLTGKTPDPGFLHISSNAYDSTHNGGSDVFVAKFSQAGEILPLQLEYGTFLGGFGNEVGTSIAVDAVNIYVTGMTYSTDFPFIDGLQNTLYGKSNAFVAVLDPGQIGEDSLLYSTYLGGNPGSDPQNEGTGYGIAVASGIAYVTGKDLGSAFVAKLNPLLGPGSQLYLNYFVNSYRGTGIAVDDASENAYVFGRTGKNFPMEEGNPMDDTYNGGITDSFVAEVDSSGDLVSSTYLGGKKQDWARGMALHKGCGGKIYTYLTGQTESRNFPTTPEAYDESMGRNKIAAFVSTLEFVNTGSPVGDPPVVFIDGPVDGQIFESGETILFAGTASDTEDENLSSDDLVWTSDKDGQIGTGGSFSATLSVGNHTITATVTDSDCNTGSASISITVGTTTDISVVSINYSTTGGKNRDKHLVIEFNLSKSVAEASLLFNLYQYQYKGGPPIGSYSYAATGSGATITFTHKNAQPGWYTSEVTEVIADGLTWDGVTPENGFDKK